MHSDAKMDWVESPTSTLHDQQLDDDQWNAADTNETQCVPIVYEPLDSSPDAPKPRRFPRGLKLVLPFKRQSGSFEGGSKPDMRENGQEIRNRRRKLSLPESGVNRVFSRSSSGGSGSEFDATSSCASMDALYMSHSGSMTLTYQNGTGAATSDPVANALRVMVTLSSNKECLSTLVSYICLPKCISKLVVHLSQIGLLCCSSESLLYAQKVHCMVSVVAPVSRSHLPSLPPSLPPSPPPPSPD